MRIDSKAPISLSSFNQVKGQDGEVEIVVGKDGQPQVIASGVSSSGKTVDWVPLESQPVVERQVVGRFLDALSVEYGPRITNAIAREIGLDAQTASLDTRTVEVAMRMAKTQQDVFSGANFFLTLHCSAEARTTAFRDACAKLGIDPDALGVEALRNIDANFGDALSVASQGNREPLTPADGEKVLDSVLAKWVRAKEAENNGYP